MTRNFLFFFFLLLSVQGHVFDCLGKCKCYPLQKIIHCPLGLTSQSDIEGYTVNDLKKTPNPDIKEFKVIPESTFKPETTRAPRAKYGKSRPRRLAEVPIRQKRVIEDDTIHRFKMWLIDMMRQIRNTSRRH